MMLWQNKKNQMPCLKWVSLNGKKCIKTMKIRNIKTDEVIDAELWIMQCKDGFYERRIQIKNEDDLTLLDDWVDL